MKVLILLSFLAFSAIQAAEPEVENGMFNAVFNYLKSQPVLLKEEQRQAEDRQQNLTYFMRADGTREDCNCDPNGSEALTCDAETGQCHCKCNVIGDKCDTCASGFHNFPATADENCHECN
jgi:hypothetical protein